jgi:hypothetical protein
LLAWALWPQRSPRFSAAIWVVALAGAIGVGFGGQRAFGQLQHFLEGINSQWLEYLSRRGFDATKSHTALGQIGRIKSSGQIVVRLEVKEGSPPTLLREASYRAYRAQTWYAGSSKSDFEAIHEETNGSGNWVLLPGKPTIADVNIASYLSGGRALLPLPAGSARLEHLPAYLLSKNSAGAVFAEGPGLVIFDARYGLGTTLDSVPSDSDLGVPAKESPALKQIAQELKLKAVDSLDDVVPLTREQRERALAIVTSYFASNFTYSTWQGPYRLGNTNETPLSRFLLKTHSGHCEYFATATVLLLRQLGLPARYAVGYAVHENSGKKYVVRARDAHAWCLVWNEQKQRWQDLDTTPGTWMKIEGGRASAIQWLSDLISRVGFEWSKFRWGQSQLRQYFLWVLGPVLALLLYQILRRSRRKRFGKTLGDGALASPWPGLDSEFYQLEKKLAERGTGRPPGEPLAAWLPRVLADPLLRDLKAPLQNALRLHYRYRFDPLGLSLSEREDLRREVGSLLAFREGINHE